MTYGAWFWGVSEREEVRGPRVSRVSNHAEKQLEADAERNIPLIVLPPNKPQYNGGVERSNRTFREAFYEKPNLLADTLSTMRLALQKAVHKHNT